MEYGDLLTAGGALGGVNNVYSQIKIRKLK